MVRESDANTLSRRPKLPATAHARFPLGIQARRHSGGQSSIAPCAGVGYRRRMRWWFRPRSRCFRVVLGMALVAWTAFALDTFAHPVMMSAAPTSHASTAMAGMSSPHAGTLTMSTPNTSHDPAPTQPDGHGCCQNGHCHCASFCSGVAGAPSIAASLAPLNGPMFLLSGGGPVPARFALLLRPPIT